MWNFNHYFSDIYFGGYFIKWYYLNLFSPIISDQENYHLCRVPSCDETYLVVKNFGALKALELDGYPAILYKKNSRI